MQNVYEIGKNFYLIRSPEKDFHRNIYLKKFVRDDNFSINMVMDPGTNLDIRNLIKVTDKLIGGIKNIHLIFLSHQDPDVSSNLKSLLENCPNAIVLTSIDTWRLVKMYGISDSRFIDVEKLIMKKLKLKQTGHQVQFIPARYCHFRGAMMFYDIESRILFSGDFMAGVNTREGDGVFATKDSWNGIALFHQIYMPLTEVVRNTVDKIGFLNPLPKIIAPQHGDVIGEDLFATFLAKIANMPVGLDVHRIDEEKKKYLIFTLNSFLSSLKGTYPDEYEDLLKRFKEAGNFTRIFVFTENRLDDVHIHHEDAIMFIWSTINLLEDNIEDIKRLFISSLKEHDIAIPQLIARDFETATDEKALDIKFIE